MNNYFLLIISPVFDVFIISSSVFHVKYEMKFFFIYVCHFVFTSAIFRAKIAL